MKKLFLIRHAKSDWSIEGLTDIDRPLNKRGYTDAHLMGLFLKKYFSDKTIFVSSPAVRAISTALIFATELGYKKEEILFAPEIYEAKAEDLFRVIKKIAEPYENIFLFGHNPTISEVVANLIGAPLVDLPTCCVNLFESEAKSWPDFLSQKPKLLAQIIPANLKSD